MMIQSIQGIRNAIDLLEQGANKVNRGEYLEGFIDTQNAVRQAKANLTVIKAEDRLYKSILDIYG